MRRYIYKTEHNSSEAIRACTLYAIQPPPLNSNGRWKQIPIEHAPDKVREHLCNSPALFAGDPWGAIVFPDTGEIELTDLVC